MGSGADGRPSMVLLSQLISQQRNFAIDEYRNEFRLA
jgi:hypothetical protein